MYTLTISENQVRVLIAACDLLSRVGMGQIEEMAQFTPAVSAQPMLKDLLINLIPLATGLEHGAYHSIGAAGPDARCAYDCLQVMRHRLAWDREPDGGVFVQFDEPRRLADEPLPTIDRRL